MHLAGLSLSTLAAVAAVAGTATVALYILKLRRRLVPVAFSRIWHQVLRDKDASTWFSRLKRLLSLLLQLALLSALILALADPRWGDAKRPDGRSIVVLVDGSASMQATDVAPSRLGVAKRRVRQLVRDLGSGDSMLLALMGATPTPLSTMTNDVAELTDALDGLRSADTRANLDQALSFALDSLEGLSQPEIVLVSDGALPEPSRAVRARLEGAKLGYISVGSSGQNLAITQFSVRRYPLDASRHEAMLELVNTTDSPAQVELSLLGDGQLRNVARLSLRPKERLPRFYPDLAGGDRRLEAVIRPLDGAEDHLPADNRAYALMPERRRVRVLAVTEGNTYLEAALLLDDYLDVQFVEPQGYPPADSFDVTIFDGAAPPRSARTGGAVYLDPPEGGSPAELSRKITDFGFDTWDRKSPLLRFMAMGDIQVAHGHAFSPAAADKVVAASEFGPILVQGRRAGGHFVALGFDPRNSDFVLRVAWPLFILNAIHSFVQEDTEYLSAYRTGEVWRIPTASGIELATLQGPSGNRWSVPVQQGRAVHLGEEAGFYELAAQVGDKQQRHAFAANLSDFDESQIEPNPKLSFGGTAVAEPAAPTRAAREQLWVYLLAAVLLLSTAEWWSYHRRVTV